MISKRIAVGVASVAVGLALFAGPVAAQELPGTGCSQPCPPSGDVLPDSQVNNDVPASNNTPPAGEALPAVEVAPDAAPAVADAAPAVQNQTASGGMAVTGADIAQLAAIGVVAIGAGALLRRRSRRATVTA